jgi:hypothetical protein
LVTRQRLSGSPFNAGIDRRLPLALLLPERELPHVPHLRRKIISESEGIERI